MQRWLSRSARTTHGTSDAAAALSGEWVQCVVAATTRCRGSGRHARARGNEPRMRPGMRPSPTRCRTLRTTWPTPPQHRLSMRGGRSAYSMAAVPSMSGRDSRTQGQQDRARRARDHRDQPIARPCERWAKRRIDDTVAAALHHTPLSRATVIRPVLIPPAAMVAPRSPQLSSSALLAPLLLLRPPPSSLSLPSFPSVFLALHSSTALSRTSARKLTPFAPKRIPSPLRCPLPLRQLRPPPSSPLALPLLHPLVPRARRCAGPLPAGPCYRPVLPGDTPGSVNGH